MRKFWWAGSLIGVAVLVAGAAYGLGPKFAADGFLAAARAGNLPKLDEMTDRESVSRDLQPQLMRALRGRFDADPALVEAGLVEEVTER